jgi:hypothetical protein
MNGALSMVLRNVAVSLRRENEMKQPGFYEPQQNCNRGWRERLTLAERELSAFFRAVTDLFGAEQAELSAEDWLREFNDREFACVHPRVAMDYHQGFDSARQPSERFVRFN